VHGYECNLWTANLQDITNRNTTGSPSVAEPSTSHSALCRSYSVNNFSQCYVNKSSIMVVINKYAKAKSSKKDKKNNRVLIIVENLSVPFDRRVWQEANTLNDAGYSVSIICPIGSGYNKKREVINGISIYRHGLPLEASSKYVFIIEYLSAFLSELYLSCLVYFKGGFDVIHACNPPDTIFIIGALFKLLFKCKFVFDHHDINPELYEAKFGRRDFFYRMLLFFERMTFRTADVSIATNESYRRIAIERGGMSPDKVVVVRSGPDLNRIKTVPAVETLKRGRKYLVGYVGVMGKQEGIEFLLRAAYHIIRVKNCRDIQFVLVGGGTALGWLKGMASDLGIAEYVTFTGRVPDADLLEVLNTADVCVNPDEWNEMNDKSTMNKIMEYMALQKPIVQFDLTEGRYSAQDASLYAEPNNAIDLANKIMQLLDDPDCRALMGKKGRQRVEDELAWSHQAPRLLAAYDLLG